MRHLKILMVTGMLFMLSMSAAEDAYLDQASGNIVIPDVVLDGELFSEVTLRLYSDDTLQVVSVTVADRQDIVPPNPTYVFTGHGSVRIPRVHVANQVYSDVKLSILDSSTLALESYSHLAAEEELRTNEATYSGRINNPVVVSPEMRDIRYPDDYQATSGKTWLLENAPCELYPNVVAFPPHWMGNHELPEVRHAPFDEGVQLGLNLKDNWNRGNPAYNGGCAGDERAAFLSTMRSAVQANASFIEVIPWTFMDTGAEQWRIVNPQELSTSTIGDDDLAWITQTAHDFGLKVYWRNQIQGDLGGSIPQASADNVRQFMPAYTAFILERARYLQEIGVDGMMISCVCWFPSWGGGEIGQLFNSAVNDLIPQVKEVYDGELLFQHGTHSIAYPQIRKNIDRYYLGMWFAPDEQQKAQLDIDVLSSNYQHGINNALSENGQYSDFRDHSFILEIGVPSRDKVWEIGYVEETFCTSETDVISQTGNDCLQKNLTPDFSFQARVVQAQLEAVKAAMGSRDYSISAHYWLTANILPGTSFPHIAYSVRNKPAEKIIQLWFDR